MKCYDCGAYHAYTITDGLGHCTDSGQMVGSDSGICIRFIPKIKSMRTATCSWCGEPYVGDLIEGSDGMCLKCLDEQRVEIEEARKRKENHGIQRAER